MRKLNLIFALLIIFTMVLTSCGAKATPTAAPVSPPQSRRKPEPTGVPR